MDIKVNQLTQVSQVAPAAEKTQADGTFKFTLASRVEEQELQARLTALMEEITMQGKRLPALGLQTFQPLHRRHLISRILPPGHPAQSWAQP